MNARTFAAAVTGRTLFRYVLSGHAGRIRTCCRWMVDAAMAEDDALMVAKEWGGKRACRGRHGRSGEE